EAIIAAFALFFSSTIIIVKILSDKKESGRLHGHIAVGVILVDDLVAALALLFVVAGEQGGLGPAQIAWLLVKGVTLLGALFLFSKYALKHLTKMMATSQELLFLFALAWGFGIANLFDMVG